jgi:hypothetical protein
MTICWGNRNTSDFDRQGFYIGPCAGPGYDELRSPHDQTAKYIHELESRLARLEAVGGLLEEIRELGT